MGSKHAKQSRQTDVDVKYQKLDNGNHRPSIDDNGGNTITWLMPTIRDYHVAVLEKDYKKQREIETMCDILGMNLIITMYHIDHSMVYAK